MGFQMGSDSISEMESDPISQMESDPILRGNDVWSLRYPRAARLPAPRDTVSVHRHLLRRAVQSVSGRSLLNHGAPSNPKPPSPRPQPPATSLWPVQESRPCRPTA